MRFIPLAIWATMVPFIIEYGQHVRKIDGREDTMKEESRESAKIYLGGIVVFFILGLIS